MKNELLTINIEGTDFILDVLKEELREKNAPENVMAIDSMLYVGSGYKFDYDTLNKNFATFESLRDLSNKDRVKEIKILNLAELDPAGMAERYNMTIEKVKEKTDFELKIIPGSLLDLRWNKKMLPVLEIAGHPFFVDTAMDKLRPKDDFKSKGISLTEIYPYYDRLVHCYIIPYNPKTHEFQEINHLKIMEIPKDIIVVKFPHHQELDIVGWNVKHGFGPSRGLREKDYRLDFKAVTLPWEETNIPNSIKLNHEEKQLKKKSGTLDEKPDDLDSQVNKGRKI